MPVMDGWTATRILKNDPRTKLVPIIVVTGTSLAADVEAVRNVGGDVVLRKPCGPDVLLVTIEQVLRGEPVPASSA